MSREHLRGPRARKSRLERRIVREAGRDLKMYQYGAEHGSSDRVREGSKAMFAAVSGLLFRVDRRLRNKAGEQADR